jgi:hypothetical protein
VVHTHIIGLNYAYPLMLRYRTPARVHTVHNLAQREVGVLIRVHRLSSLCAGFARFFALIPSPSPTAWERGVARSVFGVLKRQLQRGRKLRFRTP